MKIPSADQQRTLDKRTMELEPISSIDLMERAGNRLYKACLKFLKKHDEILIVCGVGNNGGDGLVLARYLSEGGFSVAVVYPTWSKQQSPEFKTNLQLLKTTSVAIQKIDEPLDVVPFLDSAKWVFEALFGTGLSRSLDNPWSILVQQLNKAQVPRCAIDIPAGLFADQQTPQSNTVFKADKTLAIHAPKKSFFAKETAGCVGQWSVVDIDISRKAMEEQRIYEVVNTPERMSAIYTPRNKHSYKQQLGHACLFAGSSETAGAALLSAAACMRSGVGLLTACVTPSITTSLNTYIPEVMTSTQTPSNFEKYQAIGIGPGWGRKKSQVDTLSKVLETSEGIPKVVDADGLYALRNLLDQSPEMGLSEMVLTPHKGEFKHLTRTKAVTDMEYWDAQRAFCRKYGCVMLLKGANTTIATPDGYLYFNTTGNPGMATAGSGDVLTGLVLGLLAQGYSLDSAANLAVYLHGLAGDMALSNASYESLIASDISSHLGEAFKTLQYYGSSIYSRS